MSEKRKYNCWTSQDMAFALNEYKENHLGFNECCRRYNVPKPTFRRHLLDLNKKANGNIQSIGRLNTFDTAIEEELADHLLKLEERLFGITINDVRRLAFQIADKNKISHRFNVDKGMAGKAWYYGFMSRHPQLSLRQPEKVSMARAAGFNRKNVDEFFSMLKSIVDQNNITALTIYNVDESGFSTVQKRNQKIIARKGKHQVGGVASGERGVNTTVVCCANAGGQFVPPMIIFKRKRMADELKIGAPPGSVVTISDSGYINSEIFVEWLKHFIFHVKPSIENKVLLLLDGHTTHSKNLDALLLARKHGIIILQLPGHTTHRLQPLDVGFFKPMENYFTQAIEKFLRTNPGITMTQYSMSSTINEAYSKAASVGTIVNGFRYAGIWPVDRTVFNDSDFVAADVLLQDGFTGEEEIPNRQQDETRDLLNISVHDIYPLPEQSDAKKKRKLSQPAVILSSSPYKDQLEAQDVQKRKKVEKVKRNISKSEQCQNLDINKPSTSKLGGLQESMGLVPNVEVEYNNLDWYCFICEENVIEDMVQCLQCKKWAHTSCSGKGKNVKKYYCIHCSNNS